MFLDTRKTILTNSPIRRILTQTTLIWSHIRKGLLRFKIVLVLLEVMFVKLQV